MKHFELWDSHHWLDRLLRGESNVGRTVRRTWSTKRNSEKRPRRRQTIVSGIGRHASESSLLLWKAKLWPSWESPLRAGDSEKRSEERDVSEESKHDGAAEVNQKMSDQNVKTRESTEYESHRNLLCRFSSCTDTFKFP